MFLKLFLDLYERGQEKDMRDDRLTGFYSDFIEMGIDIFDSLDAERPRLLSHLFMACIDGLALQFTFIDDDLPALEELRGETKELFLEACVR